MDELPEEVLRAQRGVYVVPTGEEAMTTDLATLPYTMADLDRHDAEMLVTGSGTLDMGRLRATVAALDAARAEVAALDRHWVAKFAAESARAETLRRECDAAATQALSDSRRATQAEADAGRLRAALEDFGMHGVNCCFRGKQERCDCGLATALAGKEGP